MRIFVRIAQLALVPCFALITGGIASVAEAKDGDQHNDGDHHNASLRGAYAFTIAKTCTTSSVPYVGTILAIPSGASVSRQSSSDSGIVTYNGDGTATSIGRSSAMNIGNTTGPFISIIEFTSAIDYTVNSDGTVNTAATTNAVIVFPPPPPPGVVNTTVAVSGQVDRLQISHGKTMLVSAPAEEVAVETLVVTPPPPSPQFTQYRICVRSTTETKLQSEEDGPHDR